MKSPSCFCRVHCKHEHREWLGTSLPNDDASVCNMQILADYGSCNMSVGRNVWDNVSNCLYVRMYMPVHYMYVCMGDAAIPVDDGTHYASLIVLVVRTYTEEALG